VTTVTIGVCVIYLSAYVAVFHLECLPDITELFSEKMIKYLVRDGVIVLLGVAVLAVPFIK